VVATAEPVGPVRDGEDRLDLGPGQEGHVGAFEALGWDGQYPLDETGVGRFPDSGIAEQRVHRHESGVAGALAVVPLLFQMVEEGGDERGV
jgi:hypothetical protein